jgi:hypothetical protein
MDYVRAISLLGPLKSFCSKVVIFIDRIALLTDDDDAYNNGYISDDDVAPWAFTKTASPLPNHEDQDHDPNKAGAGTEGDDDDDDDDQALWFGATRHILHEKLEQLAITHLGDKHGETCEVADICEGSYNRVYIMVFSDGTKYTIRVPAWGNPGRWTDDDAWALRSQACTVNYIKRKTGLPVPEVVGYSDTCCNMLGHPYMITTFLQGRQVWDIWDDGQYSPDREEQRMAILKSLAQTMAKFSTLTFKAAGSLYFNNGEDGEPEIGPLYHMDEGFGNEPHTTSFEPVHKDSYKDMRAKLSKWWTTLPPRGPKLLNAGLFMFMAVVLDCLPYHESNIIVDEDESTDGESDDDDDASTADGEDDGENSQSAAENEGGEEDEEEHAETFVLAPPDFDWQNILVDENNNITGILDWDKVCTVPRYRGWAAYPHWLSTDYSTQYTYTGKPGETDWDFERYRKVYAEFMKEAMDGKGDCKFTGKSHLFQVVEMAIADHMCTFWAMQNLVRFVLPRTDAAGFFARIGEGWYPGEKVWMRKKLGELFRCEAGADDRFSF